MIYRYCRDLLYIGAVSVYSDQLTILCAIIIIIIIIIIIY
jgi:hypothetical protein